MAETAGLPLDFSRPLPPKRTQRGSSPYDATVQAFADSRKQHAAVGGEAKPDTRYIGLRKAIARLGLTDKIGVSLRAGDVWLYLK